MNNTATATTSVVADFTASCNQHHGWKKIFSASADSKSDFESKADKNAVKVGEEMDNSTRYLDLDGMLEEAKIALEGDDVDTAIREAHAILDLVKNSNKEHFAIIDDGRTETEYKAFDTEDEAKDAVYAQQMENGYRQLYCDEGGHRGQTRKVEVDATIWVRLGTLEYKVSFNEEVSYGPFYEADDIEEEDATDEEKQLMADALNQAVLDLES